MIMQLDTSINDEGIIHQFMKKSIWYNITKKKYGNMFWKKLETFSVFEKKLELKNKKAYLEYKIKLNNETIIPDISVFDNDGNLETIIECIDTSRPNLIKYECYMNSNINVIFLNTDSKIKGFGGGFIDCDLIVLKDDLEKDRFLTLLKHFAKLTYDWAEQYKYIGKFENDNTYFLFSNNKSGIMFFSSTRYSYGSFSKSNSKKIPILLKQFVEKFKKDDVVQTVDYEGPIYVPREEYMMGIRRYDRKKINYWSLQ